MQLLQLGAAVQLTHDRLVFITNNATTPEPRQQLVAAWRQCLPTAQIYQMAMDGNDCVVWHLYLPAHQGQSTEASVKRAIAMATDVGVTFDHQDRVYGSAYGAFISQHAGDLVTP